MLRDRVVLCCVCLFMLFSQTPSRNICSKDFINGVCTKKLNRFCSIDFISRVNSLTNTVLNQMEVNVTLYTPTLEDFEKCPSFAIQCFDEELNVLFREMSIPSPSLNIRKLLKTNKKLRFDCLQCELLQEQNADVFLHNLLRIFQRINDESCKRKVS